MEKITFLLYNKVTDYIVYFTVFLCTYTLYVIYTLHYIYNVLYTLPYFNETLMHFLCYIIIYYHNIRHNSHMLEILYLTFDMFEVLSLVRE